MNFESLANELLLELFEYFSSVEILQLFYNLNTRINYLIIRHFQTHVLNLKSISKYDFDLICQNYLPLLSNRIISLQLSDDDDTPQQIDSFFSYGLSFNQFSSLQSLTIYHIYSLNSLKKLINELTYLSHLRYLKITRHTILFNEFYDIGIIDSISRFQELVHCYLDITNDNDFCFPTSSIISWSLKYLSIPYMDSNVNKSIQLIHHIPKLQSLNIGIVDQRAILQTLSIKFLSMKKLKMNFFGTFNSLKAFLQTMPNLEELKIDMESNYIDGRQWKTIIENNIPNLADLHFKMSVSTPSELNKDEHIDEILNTFRCEFWTKIHHWFVQCCSMSAGSSSITYIYTLPYSFRDFFYMSTVRLKSTCPTECQYWHFDSIRNLYYSYTPSETLLLSPIQLSNIRSLDLTIPFDKTFWSLVPNFEHLNSLTVILYCSLNRIDVESTLQMILNRTPNLYSLKFFSWFALDEFPFDIKHSSIKNLDLRKLGIGYNHQQCLELCKSSIGQQCELLFITLENSADIVELVNHMKNLRALSVEFNHMVLTENENLMEWLQKQLPVACTISTCTELSNVIRLWIR